MMNLGYLYIHAGNKANSPTSHRSPPFRAPMHVLRTPTSIGLEWKRDSNGRHENIQRSTNVNRHCASCVCNCCNYSAQDAHDAVASDGDAVARAAVRAGQDFRCVGVERAVVNIEAEVNDAGKRYLDDIVSMKPLIAK
jgi:hypothetical protein